MALRLPYFAIGLYTSGSLLKTISKSDLIVLGRIRKIVPDPTRHVSKNVAPGVVGLNPPGDYVFQVVSTLRGKSQSTLRIFLPQIDASVYGDARPTITEGTLALLFLTLERDKSREHWIPAEGMRPLLVLNDKAHAVSGEEAKKDVVTQIVNLTLSSMSDPVLRCANAYALRDIVHPRIPQVLNAYTSDQDKDTQANVLACLATNQQVQAIPLIAQLEGKVYREHGGVDTGNGLCAYKTLAAVPYLNALLFEVCVYTRFAAVDALREIADKTSIPYLVAALHDPDNNISYIAYATLCRLLPKLGPLKTTPEFDAHREEILAPFYAWWRDELNGKHLPEPY